MSAAGKNRSLVASLMAPPPVTDTPTAPAEGAGRLSTRMSGLARVASGDFKEITQKLVDPARCRIWTRHNRRYDLLSPESCADLLEALRSQGFQEFPAIVRRVTDDPNFDYEVIAGARRHWSISYLRTVEHRDFKYLIEERDLTDEQAFRLSDVENRSRTDLCDYERAVDYLGAVAAYYDGEAKRMAARLEVSTPWLSRFLDLAKLPGPVVEAFGDIRVLRVNHSRQLKPFLEGGPAQDQMLEEAARLAAQQREHLARRQPLLEATKVVQALQAAAGHKPPTKPTPKNSVASIISNGRGDALFTLRRKGRKHLIFELSLETKGSTDDLVNAFRREIQKARG